MKLKLMLEFVLKEIPKEKRKEELEKLKLDVNNLTNTTLMSYIYNMEEVMNLADIIVARSGAMTITEVSIAGKPAIFIPFPYATENHQEYNAKVLEKVGAAQIILDKDLNKEILSKTLDALIEDKNKLLEMGQKAEKVSIKNVEDRIYGEIKKWI